MFEPKQRPCSPMPITPDRLRVHCEDQLGTVRQVRDLRLHRLDCGLNSFVPLYFSRYVCLLLIIFVEVQN